MLYSGGREKVCTALPDIERNRRIQKTLLGLWKLRSAVTLGKYAVRQVILQSALGTFGKYAG